MLSVHKMDKFFTSVVAKAIDNSPNALGSASGSTGLFKQALELIANKDSNKTPINEAEIQKAHEQAYADSASGNITAGIVGMAAALQAAKLFTTNKAQSTESFIVLAMTEAIKLFDKFKDKVTGSQEDAIIAAGKTALSLFLQDSSNNGLSLLQKLL